MAKAPPQIRKERIVHLAGITLGPAEPGPDTIVLHLETGDGEKVDLDFHTMLAASGMAFRQGAIPRPSHAWLASAVNLTWVDELWC